jgi:prepilin peptidase CpaA
MLVRKQPDGHAMLHTLSTSLFPALMIFAAMTDVTNFRIPNWLTGLIAILFFPMALATGMPLEQFGMHLATGLAMFVFGYILFAVGLFGGGDSKLMAAAGLWFGWDHLLSFMTFTICAGGLLAIAIGGWSIFMAMWQIHGPEAGTAIDVKLKKIKPKLPYGFAFAIGAILTFPDTWWSTVA